MRVTLLGILALAFVFVGCARYDRGEPPAPIAGEPPRMLWVWQRPQDLSSFLDTRTTGASVLVKTIWLNDAALAVEPNSNRIVLPAGAWVMACARIEIVPGSRPRLTRAQADAVVDQLAAMAQLPRIRAIQIDFDATASQRRFYRGLLESLRRRLPAPYPISITALASWCAGDDWMRGLPVQEAVPMLFRLGPNRGLAIYAHNGGVFREPLCRAGIGISTDEPLTVPGDHRIYYFDPAGWNIRDYGLIIGGGYSG